MRQSKADDHWRHLAYNPPSVTRLRRLRFSNVDAIGGGVVEFSGAISGICGANGAGKSTLLSVLYLALANGTRMPLISSRALGDFTIDEIEVDVAAKPVSGLENVRKHVIEGTLSVRWIDAANQASAIYHRVGQDANFDDFLEQTSPSKLDANQLDELSYIIGKKYDACAIYEIEDWGDDNVFTYFEVTSGGVKYRSENMGKGELSALIAYWNILVAPEASILFFEELEAHLPIRTQTALMNVLAREILQKKLFVIMSTHSAAILGRLKRCDLRMLSRAAGSVRVTKDINPSLLDDMYGIAPNIEAVLLVEDSAAKYFLQALLDIVSPDLSNSIEIAIANSDGEVLKALSTFPPKGLRRFHVAGVLDGDLRASYKGDKNLHWPVFFLPGDDSPEELLIQCDFSDLGPISRAIGVDEDHLHAALGHVAGEDHHDWLTRLSLLIGKDYGPTCYALTRHWINNRKSNLIGATRLVRAIERWLRPTH